MTYEVKVEVTLYGVEAESAISAKRVALDTLCSVGVLDGARVFAVAASPQVSGYNLGGADEPRADSKAGGQ